MNRQKRLILTAGIVAALGLLLLIQPSRNPPEQRVSPAEETADPEAVYLTDFPARELQSLTLESSETILELRSGASGWLIEGHESWELDVLQVQKLINEACHIYSEEQIEAKSTDLSPWGLDQPRVKITLSGPEGPSRFLLGAAVPGGGGSYLMEEGKGEIHRISAAASGVFQWNPEDLRNRTLQSFTLRDFAGVTLTQEDGRVQLKIRPYERTDLFTADLYTYQITGPYPYPHPVNSERLELELEKLKEPLLAEGFADSENPGDYGLGTGETLLTLLSGGGREVSLHLGDRRPDGLVYLREENSEQIYLVPADRIPFYGTDPFSYVDPFPQLVSLPAIDRIRFEAPDFSLVGDIDRSGENPLYQVNGKQVSGDQFNKIYQTLLYMQLESERDRSRPRGELLYTLSFRLEGSINQWTELNFFDDSGDNLAVARNSEEPVFLLGKYQLEKMTESLKPLIP